MAFDKRRTGENQAPRIRGTRLMGKSIFLRACCNLLMFAAGPDELASAKGDSETAGSATEAGWGKADPRAIKADDRIRHSHVPRAQIDLLSASRVRREEQS